MQEMERNAMISVAMCTYNGSKYLEEQLSSIIQQTRQPDEIVICDDQSKDDSIKIANKTLRKWNGSVRIIRNEKNLGFVKNFEKAIGLCRGDIIFLSDQDDVWASNKIEIMMEEFKKNPDVAMVFHDSEVVDKSLNRILPSFWRSTLHFNYKQFCFGNYKRLFTDAVIQGSACAFKRTIYDLAVPFPEFAYHDEWLGMTALLVGSIIPINQYLLQYRQDQNALGGLPRTFKDKIKLVSTDFSKKYAFDKYETLRKNKVLSNFLQRYLRNNYNNRYVLEIAKYYPFLQARFAFMTGKKCINIQNINKYFRYSYSTRKALQLLFLDFAEFIYSNINKRGL